MKKKIISNIVLLGLVSLFIDMSSEMVYPLIPLYLTTTLGATPVIVGFIEGIAESLASLLKVYSGYIGDVYHNKKKLAFIGYSASFFYKLILLLASNWFIVLLARIIDRSGKGIRTAPRDALLAQASDQKKLGGTFGFHKMMDMAGSAIGVIFAYLFIVNAFGYEKAFIFSIIPAIIGVLIIFFVKENKGQVKKTEKFNFKDLVLSSKLKSYLFIVFLFTLGNSSNTFLLLKAADNGYSASQVILLYLVFNVSASVLSIPAGKLSDAFGRRNVLVAAYLVYGLVYFGFAYASSQMMIALLFIAYGAYSAFISGAERAFVVENSPVNMKGTLLGLYGTIQGIGLLLSSIMAGLLWNLFSSTAPFIFGGCMGILSAILVIILFNIYDQKEMI